jgi:hypothetical protein
MCDFSIILAIFDRIKLESVAYGESRLFRCDWFEVVIVKRPSVFNGPVVVPQVFLTFSMSEDSTRCLQVGLRLQLGSVLNVEVIVGMRCWALGIFFVTCKLLHAHTHSHLTSISHLKAHPHLEDLSSLPGTPTPWPGHGWLLPSLHLSGGSSVLLCHSLSHNLSENLCKFLRFRFDLSWVEV